VNDNAFIIDDTRTACLCDVGGGIICWRPRSPTTAHRSRASAPADIGNPDAGLTVLPRRRVRPDRPTPARSPRRHRRRGCALPEQPATSLRPADQDDRAPCRIEVSRRGEPCGLHRRQAALDLLADQLGAKPTNPKETTHDYRPHRTGPRCATSTATATSYSTASSTASAGHSSTDSPRQKPRISNPRWNQSRPTFGPNSTPTPAMQRCPAGSSTTRWPASPRLCWTSKAGTSVTTPASRPRAPGQSATGAMVLRRRRRM